MAFRGVDFIFSCGFQTEGSGLYPVAENVSKREASDTLLPNPISITEVADLVRFRWHMTVRDVYPGRESLGSDLSGIVGSIPHYIYKRGGRIYTEASWYESRLSRKKLAKLRQFVWTTSDYCRIYVTTVSFYVRRPTENLVIPSLLQSDSILYVPISFGLVSRTPYLTMPKLFLSFLYHLVTSCGEELSARSFHGIFLSSVSQVVHGVSIPSGPKAATVWSMPTLNLSGEGDQNQLEVFLGYVGIDDGIEDNANFTPAEFRPIENTFFRSFTEIDLIALFDVLSVDVIISTIGALLLEQKVLLVSSRWSSSFVSHLCECFRLLLYPFDWHHVYIPLIPSVDVGDLQSKSDVPHWLPSATTRDHIHPIRYLEAPAPIFAGMKVRKDSADVRQQQTTHVLLKSLFPDLNVVDLDYDAYFSASERVDRVESVLPWFPKKLTNLIHSRIALLNLQESKSERMEKYARWDVVADRRLFGNPADVAQAGEIRPSSTEEFVKKTENDNSPSLLSSMRRKSASASFAHRPSWGGVVTEAISSQSPTTPHWFNGVSNFFTSGKLTMGLPSGLSPGSGSRRNSSAAPMEGFQLAATESIQTAFVETYCRIFFAYRDFLSKQVLMEGESPNVTTSFSAMSTVVGGDRVFDAKNFLKSVEKFGNAYISSSDSVTFIKAFLDTQCWDIFVRTTAMYPVCKVFDTCCLMYCGSNKVEYGKFISRAADTSVVVGVNANSTVVMGGAVGNVIGSVVSSSPSGFMNGSSRRVTSSLVIVPPDVVSEAERQLSIFLDPKGSKQKDSFFDQIKLFMMEARRDIKRLSVSTELWQPELCVGNNREIKDSLDAISVVLGTELPQVFNNRWFNTRDTVPDVQTAAAVLARLAHGLGSNYGHLLHAVLGTWATSDLPRRDPVRLAVVSTDQVQEDEPDTHHNYGSSFPSKIHGGIPISALNHTVARSDISKSILREFDPTKFSLRVTYQTTGIGWIEYTCAECGHAVSFHKALKLGGFADTMHEDFFSSAKDSPQKMFASHQRHNDHVSYLCPSCKAAKVTPMIGNKWGSGNILKLNHLCEQVSGGLPLSLSVELNLMLICGMRVEVYSGLFVRHSLKAAVPLIDILSDYADDMADLPVLSPSSSSKPFSKSPRNRAAWRFRDHRRITREKERYDMSRSAARPLVPVVRINVDAETDEDRESVLSADQPPVKPPPIEPSGNSFIRKSAVSGGVSTINSAEATPVVSSMLLPPVPPSERRPTSAAPRRVRNSSDKQASGFQTPLSHPDDEHFTET